MKGFVKALATAAMRDGVVTFATTITNEARTAAAAHLERQRQRRAAERPRR